MTQAQAQYAEIDWDAALVVRASAGDARAFERIYREHSGRVYGLCLRMTRDAHLAEDCTQETFINAWRALGRCETRSSLGTWLHRIAVNACLAKRRKASPYDDAARARLLAKRGRYVEFNLVYDRGTRFGFATDADPDAYLMSLPPLVSW